MEAFSQSVTSAVRSGCQLQDLALGVEAVFPREESRAPREAVDFGVGGLQSRAGWPVTGGFGSPLVLRLGDNLKSLPTIFFS